MVSRFMDFKDKEIINLQNGMKIGYVDDIVFDTQSASIQSIVVYGRLRFFGILGREEDTFIAWDDIATVGEDTILIKSDDAFVKRKAHKPTFLDKLFT